MELIRTVAELRPRLNVERAAGKTIGMVGTSGGMHEGHLSLIRRSAADNDITVLFWGGAPADLGWKTASMSYVRDAARDFPMAEAAGCQVLFAPTAQELYPTRPITKVSLPAMVSDVPHLEDPAHLDLIAFMMCKLWNMVGPCTNYFGEKDWQQLVMFQRLAADMFYPVSVVGSPTIREADGLALSSRNAQLTDEERARAPYFYRALVACRDAVQAGKSSVAELEALFRAEASASGEVLYFTVVPADGMTPVPAVEGPVRILASLRLGTVRLMDNIGVGTSA